MQLHALVFGAPDNGFQFRATRRNAGEIFSDLGCRDAIPDGLNQIRSIPLKPAKLILCADNRRVLLAAEAVEISRVFGTEL